MKFKNYLEKDLNEGMFGDFFSDIKKSAKLGFALGKESEAFNRLLKMLDSDHFDANMLSKDGQKIIKKAMTIIGKSGLDNDMKDTFAGSFIVGVLKSMKAKAPELSSHDVQKIFQIKQDVYNRAIRSLV